jgi:hypothetical protein
VVARDARDHHWVYFSITPGQDGPEPADAIRRGIDRAGDNGTIVDFILKRAHGRIGLREVHAECHRWLGRPDPGPLRSDCDVVPSHPTERDRLSAAIRFQAARQMPSSRYLSDRGLRPDTLQDPKFRNTWRQDERGNVLFVHRDDEGISGYELKSRRFTGFAKGGVKSLWYSDPGPSDRQLVVTESALDALSYHQLHPCSDARYMSVGGMPSSAQLRLLERAVAKLPNRGEVVVAVDADKGGDKLHAVLNRHLALPHVALRRHSPDINGCKDWNDVLQHLERSRLARDRAWGRGLER